MKKLRILMITSECVPFAKTGGLADVVGALPAALKALGHDVRVVMPRYYGVDIQKFKLQSLFQSLGVWMGGTQEWASVYQSTMTGDVPVYFIEHHQYFGRDGLYHDKEFNDFQDNPRRFTFLTRAALQLTQDLQFAPDIVHSHDWQTAAASAYLKTWHWNDPILGGAASVLTIHNLAYQGIYPGSHWGYIGLGERNFTWDKFECYGGVNLLKGGIATCDALNTVSPTYCRETKTPENGYGLDGYLRHRGDDYWGILNGIDYSQWNPEVDKLIPANYTKENLTGKAACKKALQEKLHLTQDPTIPVIGIVSRLVSQKGLDLLAACIEGIVGHMRVQFAILGSGDKGLENYFGGLPARYSGKIGCYIGYDNGLSHLIEAGSDFFLMPSIYEPCGLNQIYSLKYGTLPIVRATGGLDDTVENYDETTGKGTGFKFWDPTPNALYYTVGWAVSTWYDRKSHMDKMVRSAMSQHYSWEDSAKTYVKLYERAIENKKRL